MTKAYLSPEDVTLAIRTVRHEAKSEHWFSLT